MTTTNVIRGIAWALLLAVGCGAESANSAAPGAGGSGGTAGVDAGGSGALALTLPLDVDAHFGPSGCYGRIVDGTASLDPAPDPLGCSKPADAAGDKCWRITYATSGSVPDGGDMFGGCAWVLDPSFAVAQPIEAGATKLVFYAASAGAAKVTFYAGAFSPDGSKDTTMPPVPGMTTLARSVTLGPDMTRYEIPLADLASRTQIYAPFGWTVVDADSTTSTVSFEVAGIQWVK